MKLREQMKIIKMKAVHYNSANQQSVFKMTYYLNKSSRKIVIR